MFRFSSRCWMISILAIGYLSLTIPLIGFAQLKNTEKRKSPSSMIKESDLDYRLWEGFLLIRKANSGDPQAQHELGLRYFSGRGLFADTAKSVIWLKRAAEQELDIAHYNLSLFYLNGWGVDWNPFYAFHYLLKAAIKNMPEAQFALSLMYTENLVVPKNHPEAFRLMQLAHEAKYPPAEEAIIEYRKRGFDIPDSLRGEEKRESGENTIKEGMTDFVFLSFEEDTAVTNIPIDSLLTRELFSDKERLEKFLGVYGGEKNPELKGFRLLERSAIVGSPEARLLLGKCYEDGFYCPRDLIRSAGYYLSALRLDYPLAYDHLTRLLRNSEFLKLLESKAKAGDVNAQFVWSRLSTLRLDYRLTETQALQFLNNAASRNHIDALIELGMAYATGKGINLDKTMASQLWKQATQSGSEEAGIRLAISQLFDTTFPPTADLIPKLTKLMEEGSILAQTALGFCQENGYGIEKDKAAASRLYRKSARRGSYLAYSSLRRMYDEIRPEDKIFQLEK